MVNKNIRDIDKYMELKEFNDNLVKWFNPNEEPFIISGFYWLNKDKIYRRLPIDSGYKLSEGVEFLANCTAGGQIKFRTDSKLISIKVKLTDLANMEHMPATGQCGFDCYIKKNGRLQYCSTTRYDHKKIGYENELYKGNKDTKEVVINFPLYQGVEEVLIGLDNSATVYRAEELDYKKNIVFYGTSITQGGCASRPGMCYTNILSRKLGVNCINLGFSGNGKGEPEMAKIISEMENIDLLVLDYEANCVTTELYKETLPQFIKIYREKQKKVPILLLPRIPFSSDLFYESNLQEREERNRFQKNLIDNLRREDYNIYFFDMSSAFDEDFFEATVDGVHPTDYGFSLIADKLYSVIKNIL